MGKCVGEIKGSQNGSVKVGRYDRELLLKSDPRQAFVHQHLPQRIVHDIDRQNPSFHPKRVDSVWQLLVR